MSDVIPQLIGMLFGGAIGALIGSLIGAIFLRAAAKWVLKDDVPYGQSYITVLISCLLNLVLGMGVGFAVGVSVDQSELEGAARTTQLVMLPVGFLLQSAVIAKRHDATFGRAMLVTLTMFLLALAVGLVVGLLIAGIMTAI